VDVDDVGTPTVYSKSEFREYNVQVDSLYECPGGETLAGTTCEQTNQLASTYSCPGAWVLQSDNTCTTEVYECPETALVNIFIGKTLVNVYLCGNECCYSNGWREVRGSIAVTTSQNSIPATETPHYETVSSPATAIPQWSTVTEEVYLPAFGDGLQLVSGNGVLPDAWPVSDAFACSSASDVLDSGCLMSRDDAVTVFDGFFAAMTFAKLDTMLPDLASAEAGSAALTPGDYHALVQAIGTNLKSQSDFFQVLDEGLLDLSRATVGEPIGNACLSLILDYVDPTRVANLNDPDSSTMIKKIDLSGSNISRTSLDKLLTRISQRSDHEITLIELSDNVCRTGDSNITVGSLPAIKAAHSHLFGEGTTLTLSADVAPEQCPAVDDTE
jgi:hypothetical protein